MRPPIEVPRIGKPTLPQILIRPLDIAVLLPDGSIVSQMVSHIPSVMIEKDGKRYVLQKDGSQIRI